VRVIICVQRHAALIRQASCWVLRVSCGTDAYRPFPHHAPTNNLRAGASMTFIIIAIACSQYRRFRAAR
jgi:hypothetical protein